MDRVVPASASKPPLPTAISDGGISSEISLSKESLSASMSNGVNSYTEPTVSDNKSYVPSKRSSSDEIKTSPELVSTPSFDSGIGLARTHVSMNGNSSDPIHHGGGKNVVENDMAALEAKYAPFVRHDTYGIMGQEPISIWEQLKLAVAAFTLLPARLMGALFFLLVFFSICKFIMICRQIWRWMTFRGSTSEEHPQLTGLSRLIVTVSGRFCARGVLFAFGFYQIKETVKTSDMIRHHGLGVSPEGPEKNKQRWPTAVVSNHISFIDILYHMSSSFPSFVAKKGVAKLPFVGLISQCMGCVYIEREKKTSDTVGVSGIVRDRLQAAQKDQNSPLILLFPEGTTTNGNYLLPFKTGAFLGGSPVLPVLLRYPYKRFSPAWESLDAKRHLFLLLCQFVNHLEVIRLPVYCPSALESSDPRLYASNVRKLLIAEGNVQPSELGLYDKRVYHALLAGESPPPPPYSKSD